MNAINFFRCDDLADTNGVDLFAGPPTLTAADNLAGALLVAPLFRLTADALLADAGFLQIVTPELYLARGTMAARFMAAKRESEGKPYVAAVGSRNALRHTLHQTGVL